MSTPTYSLRELEATLHRYDAADGSGSAPLDRVQDANGLLFLCPKCFEANGGSRGTHSVLCLFVGVPPGGKLPGPGRWTATGNTIDDVTLAPSVRIASGCGWHGFVERGRARTD